jgi:peptidoglycan hydrolase-like protein with peptidoglycan-binding domain
MLRRFLLVSTALLAVATVSASGDPGFAAPRVGLATDKLSPVQLVAYDPLVYRAQVALSQKGFNVGKPDGVFGPRTRAGIEAYQRATGIAVTGQVSESLLAELEGARPGRNERIAERRQDRREVRNLSYSELVAETQAELSRLGYDLTFVRGGRLNGETRDAIADYQRRHNLEQTGTPTPALLLQLRRDDNRISDRSWRDRRGDWRDDYADRDRDNMRVVTRLSDDFSDGDFTRNQSWRVLSGSWSVSGGVLMSNVPIRQGQSLFPPVFNQLEQRLGISPAAHQDIAAISTTRAIDNAFRISITLGGRGQAPASLNFGPYLGADANSGYRLVYDGESSRPLKLMVGSGSGLQTIASGAPSANLFDGRMHAVEWTRDRSGHMVVLIDGLQALSVGDSSLRQDFDGFSVINGGGSWGIDTVTVQNVRG